MGLFRPNAKSGLLRIAAFVVAAVVFCIAGCKSNHATANQAAVAQPANQTATPNTNRHTPTAQTDDGSQEVADLHRRESLLLEHYSWVNSEQGTVRIPIERAMEIVAQGKTIEVLPPAATPPPMTGDRKPVVTAPLTNGSAPTTYEQTQDAERGR